MPTPTKAALALRRFGKYVLVAKMAEGGMAEIHLAVEEMGKIGRRFVIIKRIRATFERDPDYVEYFLTEGQIALRVAHPNLPMAYELGEVDGVYYLAMEFIRGPTLLDLLRRAHRAKTELSVQSALTIGRMVAAALEHTHGLCDVDGQPLQVIHRDVTPQNTLIGYDGTVKLIDFGIVQSRVQTHETAAGVVKGKFSYLAPEQINRRDKREKIDHRADLFSLGIMMHEALLGRVLFRGRTDRDTIKRVLRAPIPNPSLVRAAVPESLSRVVLRALQRDPERRYRSATALLADLEHVAATEGLDSSVINLREEVGTLCGTPQRFRIPALSKVAVADAPKTNPQPKQRTAKGSEPPPPPGAKGIAADADLRYFLRQAGVVIPSKRPRRLRTTCTDVEFAELLATLER